MGAQSVPQALPSVPPRTHICCFHQRISKEERALVRGNSNAGLSHGGCQGPERDRVLPNVTQQGWNRELLAVSLLLSLHSASHVRLTSYFTWTFRSTFLFCITELSQLLTVQEMGTCALQERKLRLRDAQSLAQGITEGWRNCWDKAGFLILSWLFPKVWSPGPGPADPQSDHWQSRVPWIGHMDLGWTQATGSAPPKPRQWVCVPVFEWRRPNAKASGNKGSASSCKDFYLPQSWR